MPVLIILTYVSLLALSLLDNLRGPFFPEILHDFSVSATQGSLFFASASLASFVASWGAPAALHRMSSVTLLAWSAILLGIGYSGISLLPDYNLVLIASVVFGAAYGGLNLAHAVVVGEATSGDNRRRVFSGLHAMYGMASLAAPLLASLSRNAGWTWRQSFLLVSTTPLFVGVWAWTLRKLTRPHSEATRAEPLSSREWWQSLAYALILAAYLWGEVSISTRAVLWLRQSREFSPDRADNYLAAFFTMLLVGRIIFGFLGFKGVSNWIILAGSAGGGALLFALGLIYNPMLIILAALVMSPFYPVCMDQVSRHFGAKSPAALGFVIGFGSLAVVAMHLIVGAITDAAGLTVALQVCAAVMALMSVILGVHATRIDGRGGSPYPSSHE